jgi:hypothetical protein
MKLLGSLGSCADEGEAGLRAEPFMLGAEKNPTPKIDLKAVWSEATELVRLRRIWIVRLPATPVAHDDSLLCGDCCAAQLR